MPILPHKIRNQNPATHYGNEVSSAQQKMMTINCAIHGTIYLNNVQSNSPKRPKSDKSNSISSHRDCVADPAIAPTPTHIYGFANWKAPKTPPPPPGVSGPIPAALLAGTGVLARPTWPLFGVLGVPLAKALPFCPGVLFS
jgi:hypothetical protein